jgi:hypothetical protein
MLMHLDTVKILDYVHDHVWWKDMATNTNSFCESYLMCKCSKLSNEKPFGLLNSLPIPGLPWELIGIDFVGLLPKSSN